MSDKVTQTLLDALKQALAEPGEQRLFRSGKLAGVFAGRTGQNGEAAARALRDGLLEVVRTDTKGKTAVEFVRVTPRGVEFVHQHESPVGALQDLRAVLQMTQDGVPVWMGELRKELDALGQRLTEQAVKITRQIDVLSARVIEALKRAEAAVPPLPQELAGVVPWGPQALEYLDKRKASGVVNLCPLPELFAALREKQPELTITDYHAGLRRLHDKGVVRLVATEKPEEIREPEYALLDGAVTYYHVAR